MTERKRFKKQELNGKDYEKIERRARILKNGSAISAASAFLAVVAKKYGPNLIADIRNLRKR